MREQGRKVGQLARQAGISVRTLHHYDEIGLLRPSRRTEAGHRLYTGEDVARLQQIKSLRQLGFGLEEIGACLDSPAFSPQRVIALHVAALRERIELQRGLCDRLEAIAARLGSAEEVSAEEFLKTIEVMSMAERVEKYYTPEQLEELRQRARTVGEERIREVEAEWPRLMAEVRAEMEAGTDPTSERVRGLAARWSGLVAEFTGNNPGIEQSLRNVWRGETEIHGIQTAETRALGEYIAKANTAS